MKKYLVQRECGNCNHIFSFEISKREAAFELFSTKKLIEKSCEKCLSKKFKSLSIERPEIDEELILEWIKDDNLYFLDQDEDLLLADVDFKILLDILDNYELSSYKHSQLVSALCVSIYDNSVHDEGDIDLRNQVINELKKRKKHIQKADYLIMDYIKEVVYPQINFVLLPTTDSDTK